MKKGFVVTAIIAVVVLSSPLSAQQIEYVGSTLWTGVNDIEVEGNIACVLFNNGLVTYDISDSANFVELDRIFIRGNNDRIAIKNTHAFILGQPDGLKIVDISNPNSLELLGNCDTPGKAWGIAIAGDYAYIADGDSGIAIINITYPSNPILAISNRRINFVHDVAFSDSILYAIGGTGAYYSDSLFLLSINDSLNPQTLGQGAPIYCLSSYRLKTFENYAYILTAELSHFLPYVVLQIFNIADSASPFYCGSITFSGYNGRLEISDNNYAMLSNSSGFWVLNISNKYSPSIVSNLYLTTISDLCCNNNNLYYTADQFIGIIDISEPTMPNAVNQYTLNSPISVVCAADNYLYSLCSSSDLWIAEISNPVNPSIISYITMQRNPADIQISNTILYTLFESTFSSINCSNPENPLILSQLSNSNYGGNFYLLGNYAYVPSFTGMNIIDVSDPSHLRNYSNFSFSGGAHDIDVKGNYVYITGGSDGLIIADISNITNPIITGTCPIRNSPKGIKIKENWAYVLGNFNFFGVYDISLPQAPSLVAQLQINSGTALDISETRAYISSSQDGLIVLDLSDPSSPQIAETYPNVSANDVRFSHGYVYLATSSSVIIFRDLATGLEEVSNLPSSFSLSPNYPNPFNSSTTIRYYLPTESPVIIDIYDILGRKVQTLLDVKAQAGPHQVNWDADGLPSGAYFARLKAGQQSQTTKMILMK